MKYLVIPLEKVDDMPISVCETLKMDGIIINLDSSIEERAEELYPIADVDCGEFGIVDSNYWDRENYLEGYNDAQIVSEIEKVELLELFLDSIRDYENESHHSVYVDERESKEFVKIFLNNQSKNK